MFDQSLTATQLCYIKNSLKMTNKDRKPPLLTGFSSSGAGKGKALSSPTTSLWMAIIFVALFAALMSIQRNINSANDSFIKKEDGGKYSGYIVDAPEQFELGDPPPNPESLYLKEEDTPIVLNESIELEKEIAQIEIKPIDIELDVELPESSLQANGLPE